MDALKLRGAFSRFATGVTVVTAVDDAGRAIGMTVNSFASLSLEPPLLLWNLQNNSECRRIFADTAHFAVNVLTLAQREISNRCAAKGRHALDGVEWSPGVGGAPALDGALACFECATHARHTGGDHLILVGKIENFSEGEGEPLLFYGGGYRRIGAALD